MTSLAASYPDPQLRSKPHLVIMSALFLTAIAAAYLMLPGDTERVAMLERDGQHRAALRVLESRFEQGDRRQRVLFQMQRLYEQFGDIARARLMLELLVKERPRDLHVLRQQAQFYKLIQDEPAYVRSLEGQLALRYSEPACRELIGIHRRVGNHAAEQEALARCGARGYRRTEDVVRMGFLLAADGEFTRSAELLRSVDNVRRLKTDRDRLMLFAALLETDQAGEAKARGVRWMKAARDDTFALLLVDTLVREQRHDVAIELAREVGTPGDSISLSIAELMLDRAQTIAARSYLRGWLEKADLSRGEVLSRFVAAALDAGDPLLALNGAKRGGVDKIEQTQLVELAESLSAAALRPQFIEIRGHISEETMRLNPLLAAVVALDRGAPEPARELLSRVQVGELDEWRLSLWARLMESTGNRAAAVATLRQLGVDTDVVGPVALPGPRAVVRRTRDKTQLRPPPRRVRVARPGVPGTKPAGPKSAPAPFVPQPPPPPPIAAPGGG